MPRRLAVRDIQNSMLFDAAADKLDVVTSFDPMNDWTNFFYLKMNEDVSVDQAILTSLAGTGTSKLLLYFRNASGMFASQGASPLDYTFDVPFGKWMRMAVVHDNTANTRSLYVNGVFIETLSLTASASDGGWRFGNRATLSRQAHASTADMLLIEKACTAQEIEDEYFDNKIPDGGIGFRVRINGDDTATDIGPEAHTVTVTGATSESDSPFKARVPITQARLVIAQARLPISQARISVS